MEKSFECKKLEGFFICRNKTWENFFGKFFWKIFWVGNCERVNCPMEIPPLKFGRKAPPAMKESPKKSGWNYYQLKQ